MSEPILKSAMVQCGEAPPYNLLNIPVRMNGNMPQINNRGEWLDFPRGGPRPVIKRYFGQSVAGISPVWEYE